MEDQYTQAAISAVCLAGAAVVALTLLPYAAGLLWCKITQPKDIEA